MSDANSLHRLISHFADKGEVLPRALSEIYDGIRDYFVVRKERSGYRLRGITRHLG